MVAKILIIAGSDSGGGAGIQADIKTITNLGGYASTAITALTAQNTLGVQGIFPIPVDFIEKQIESVLSDIGADVIKTGMLYSPDIIKLIADIAKQKPEIKLVADPVMVATSGDSLAGDDITNTFINHLIPQAFLVTPNIPEAEILTGSCIKKEEEMIKAAQKIIEMGAKHVLIKGGHLEGNFVTDIMLSANGDYQKYKHTRIDSRNTHGTGCSLASAISCYLSQGLNIATAVEKSIDYIETTINNAPNIGKGHGPLGHESYKLSIKH